MTNPKKHAKSDTLYEQLDMQALPKFLYGGFWIRVFAYLFDLLIIRAITSILLNLFVYRLFGIGVSESFWAEGIRLIIFLAYFFGVSYFLKGQTLGKILFRLRVVRLNPSDSWLQTLLVREVAGKAIFYYFPYIAVLLVFTSKRQHVVDLLADTAVVNEGKLWEGRWFAAQRDS